MPINVNIPSEVLPGTTYQAWTWGPRVRIDAGQQVIMVEYEAFASPEAAYASAKPVAHYTTVLSGKDFRNFVRENTALWESLTSAIDAAALQVPALASGVPTSGTNLPAWVSEPLEVDTPPSGG